MGIREDDGWCIPGQIIPQINRTITKLTWPKGLALSAQGTGEEDTNPATQLKA